MPTFDVPESTRPVKVILYRDYREHVFLMPHTTEDPLEIEMLREFPLTEEATELEAVLDPESGEQPLPEVKDWSAEIREFKPKPSRKEV